MSQGSDNGSAIADRRKESIGGSEFGIEEREGNSHNYQSNELSTTSTVLKEGVEASKLVTDIEWNELENEGKSKGGNSKDDESDDKNTQESSVYHAPYHDTRKFWECPDELVFLAGERREKGSAQAYNSSPLDTPKGPLTDIPDSYKLRLWISGANPVSPVEELEEVTEAMIDAAVELGENDRVILDKDRDIETIKAYARQLKAEYELEIHEKDAEIQALKVSFKESLLPLQPYYSERSELEREEYEKIIQKKDTEIQALKASLRKSLPPTQGLSAPGTYPIKPSEPSQTATLLEIASRTNNNLLKALARLQIVRANDSLWDGAYREAHEFAFEAEKLINNNKLELDSVYAGVIFCKAKAEYGLGCLELAADLFQDARRYGINGEQVDPWVEKCNTGSEGWPFLGHHDYTQALGSPAEEL